MFRSCVGVLLCVFAACEGKTQQMPAAPPPTATVPGVIPGQVPATGTSGYRIISPITQPALTPGVVELMELEGRFQQAVAQGGGKVFSEWFAEDAVVLNNGKPAILGRGAIAAQAQWDPKSYQLNWSPQGALMGPSNDMGYTWGHYEGRATNPDGQPLVTSGRYFTVWRKTKDGGWKVVMDASANEPPETGTCCALPKP
jgi:ketosteroid isomerase-like protein